MAKGFFTQGLAVLFEEAVSEGSAVRSELAAFLGVAEERFPDDPERPAYARVGRGDGAEGANGAVEAARAPTMVGAAIPARRPSARPSDSRFFEEPRSCVSSDVTEAPSTIFPPRRWIARHRELGYLAVGALLTGFLVLGVVAARRTARPLEHLRSATRQLSLGRYDIDVPHPGTTELAELAGRNTVTIPAADAEWPTDIRRRRALVDLVTANVELDPSDPAKRGTFDPHRVRITPR